MVFLSSLLVAFTNFANTEQTTYLTWHIRSTPQVDLGYAVYAGTYNASSGLDVFKGIRFAAPPTGALRWQAPQPPIPNRDKLLKAEEFGAACPHSLRSGQYNRTLPDRISEDCLFVNVWAPKHKSKSGLPVFVNIHGGGYGVGDGREDLSGLVNANNSSFVAVNVQYRLGALGFLASDEVKRKGVLNAGLLDQQAALRWVQEHIAKFGGDPRKVTIFGVSAGGGSVMLHDMAYGGTQGTELFTNSISMSPYLPQQHAYNDYQPSQAYYAFATHAGCPPTWAYGNSTRTIFECLVSKDTHTLQAAASAVSSSGLYGTWAFTPVTDGTLIQSLPSTALSTGSLNGMNHLTSNTAEESFAFVPQTISNPDALQSYLDVLFPSFTSADFTSLFATYPLPKTSLPRFATSGRDGASSLQTSPTASGIQQLANLIFAESTFICPSYWLAAAYSSMEGKRGYKLQYSVPIALHGYDGITVFGNQRLPNQGADFVSKIQRLIGTFVVKGEVEGLGMFSAKEGWKMLNLNTTGGMEERVDSTLDVAVNELGGVWHVEPRLRAKFEDVDGWAWERSRGGEMCVLEEDRGESSDVNEG